MLIPIGHDQQTVRRLPWVTIAIIGLNFLFFLGVGGSAKDAENVAEERLQRTIEYWQDHPYLDLPESFIDVAVPPGERNQFRIMAEAMKGAGVDIDQEQRREEQSVLDDLARDVIAARDEHPYFSWGLVPAKPSASAFLSSMFMHASWLHLLSNLFILFLAGPAIEDVYGRPWYTAFYLVSGVVASLAHIASFPQSDSPLVGASGALAGVMGAFLIRCSRTKIRFFYWYFLRGGTFDAPAWFMLPLWLLQQVFYGMLTKSADGVAYWAHVGGFVFGAVVALAMKRLRVEERYIHPKIESKITLEQHPGLRDGVDLLARGEIEAARESLARAIADEPGNPDAHLAMWQSYAQIGEARRGAGEMVKVIEAELKAGEVELAVNHWRELVENASLGGPASLRWRLASQLAEAGKPDADEVFHHLAADPTADLLGEKARRRLGLPEPPANAAATEASMPGPALDDPGRRVDLHIGDAATGRDDGDVVVHELQAVAVAGDDRHLDAALARRDGEGAEQVIGLVAALHEVGETEGLDQLRQMVPLYREEVGHVRPLHFVLFVLLVAKGLLSRVPGDDHRAGPVVGDDLEEHLAQAVQRVGREAVAGGDGLRQGEVGAVGETAAVDEEESLREVGGAHDRILPQRPDAHIAPRGTAVSRAARPDRHTERHLARPSGRRRPAARPLRLTSAPRGGAWRAAPACPGLRTTRAGRRSGCA